MLLDGILLHPCLAAQVAYEGIEAVVVEKVKGTGLDYFFKMLFESMPDLKRAGGLLVRRAFVLEKLLEIAGDGRTLRNLRSSLLFFRGRVGIIAVDYLPQFFDGGTTLIFVLEIKYNRLDPAQKFVDLSRSLFFCICLVWFDALRLLVPGFLLHAKASGRKDASTVYGS